MIANKEQVESNIEEDEVRFGFGKNWKRYLTALTYERIQIAEDSLSNMLGVKDLKNITFLDIGSGSGLFSLCANRLGAKVHSFDYDDESVNCTKYLKDKYFKDSSWVVEQGSALDKAYLESLGKYDIVYSWGVLHHTGNMILALENAIIPVKIGGKLFISIYNDQGRQSDRWLKVKKLYNSNIFGKYLVLFSYGSFVMTKDLIADLLHFRNPFKRFTDYKQARGMSRIYDWYDWLGGMPFEVATPELIFDFYKERGFILEKMTTSNGLACNEFVFTKIK